MNSMLSEANTQLILYTQCCSSNLNIDQFLDSTEVLPILREFKWGFQLEVSQFCSNLGLNYLLVIVIVPFFSVGKIIYWVDNFGQRQV